MHTSSHSFIYNFLLAVIGGLFVCLVSIVLLSLLLNDLFFTVIYPPFELMDPESNAVEISGNITYLIADNLIWFISIALAGFASALISRGMKFSPALVVGWLIFGLYYLNLPASHIIAIYPVWYIYSPLVMSLTLVFIGPAIISTKYHSPTIRR